MKKFLFFCVVLFYIVALSAQSNPIITVLDFKTQGLSQTDMRTIISLLSSGLFETGKFTVIDITQRDNLLKEIEFSKQDCSDETCQLEIGKQLSAEMIVVGNLTKIGNRHIISIKILRTNTGETLSVADGIYQSLDDLVDNLNRLAIKLSGVKNMKSTENKSTEPITLPDTNNQIKVQNTGLGGTGILGLTMLILGSLSAGTGAYFWIDSEIGGVQRVNDAYNRYINAVSDWDPIYQSYLNTLEREKFMMNLGIGLTGGGVLVGTTGLILMLLDKPVTPANTSLFILPNQDKVCLGFTLSY